MTAMDLNLDAMPIEEVKAFAYKCGTCRTHLSVARELFPDRPKGYRNAANLLGHYAWNKLTAMDLRLKGSIEGAIQYENICDSIYSRLPEWAKGW